MWVVGAGYGQEGLLFWVVKVGGYRPVKIEHGRAKEFKSVPEGKYSSRRKEKIQAENGCSRGRG